MIVVDKNRVALINLDHVICMYIGEGNAIKANYASGSGSQVARYNTPQEATEALKLLAEAIGKAEVFYMPEDEAVKTRIGLRDQKYHHAAGKKTKGHGGS